MSGLKFRILTREEAATVPGMVDPMPESLTAVGAVDPSGVVCCIGLFLVLHADPIWIRDDWRNSGKLPLHLWQATRDVASVLGPEVFVGMSEDNPGQPTESLVERMVESAGGQELKARFFTIPVGAEHGI
jgi:hypothetical protein